MQQCRQERHVKTHNVSLLCVREWHCKQRWGIIPEPTYWMSLSHTHHHLSPGCPIGRPKRARTEERQEGRQPQHKQKRLEAVKRKSCGPTECVWAASRGGANTPWSHWGCLFSLKNWVIKRLPDGGISHQNELHWPGSSPADWSASEPRCLWLSSNIKREETKMTGNG